MLHCVRVVAVTVNEVEALYELYKKLNFSIFKDSLIHNVIKLLPLPYINLTTSVIILSDDPAPEL